MLREVLIRGTKPDAFGFGPPAFSNGPVPETLKPCDLFACMEPQTAVARTNEVRIVKHKKN